MIGLHVLSFLMLRVLSSKAQGCNDICKTIKNRSCWYSLDISRCVLSAEYPYARFFFFLVVFHFFLIILHWPNLASAAYGFCGQLSIWYKALLIGISNHNLVADSKHSNKYGDDEKNDYKMIVTSYFNWTSLLYYAASFCKVQSSICYSSLKNPKNGLIN